MECSNKKCPKEANNLAKKRVIKAATKLVKASNLREGIRGYLRGRRGSICLRGRKGSNRLRTGESELELGFS